MTVALRRTRIKKEKLREIISENPDAIHHGLRFIDQELSTGECGVIDLLGVDAAGRLMILSIATEENIEMLVSVLSQLQWMKTHEGIMNRLLTGKNVDCNHCPGVLLVAPAFSEKLKEAAKQVRGVDMKLIVFEYFIADDSDAACDAAAFEQIFHSVHSGHDRSSTGKKCMENGNDFPVKSSSDLKYQSRNVLPSYNNVILTAEEIGEFIDFNKDVTRKKIAE